MPLVNDYWVTVRKVYTWYIRIQMNSLLRELSGPRSLCWVVRTAKLGYRNPSTRFRLFSFPADSHPLLALSTGSNFHLCLTASVKIPLSIPNNSRGSTVLPLVGLISLLCNVSQFIDQTVLMLVPVDTGDFYQVLYVRIGRESRLFVSPQSASAQLIYLQHP